MSYIDLHDVLDAAQPDTIREDAHPYLLTLIDRACRIFDKACGVSEGYFDEAGASSAQTIYGTGGNYLPVPPHVGTLTISLPEGYTAPDFLDRDGYLIVKDSYGVLIPMGHPWLGGWPSGLPITITGVWGHEAIPEDVKAAVIELTINLFRETDPVAVKLVNLEGMALRERLPPRVKMIADKYRMNRTVFV